MMTRTGFLAIASTLWACGGSEKPVAAPGPAPAAGATAGETAVADAHRASVTCYAGTGAVMLPDGREVATLEALARRTLDPGSSTIVEEFVNLKPRRERYVVTMRVDGSRFTMTEQNQAFTGAGELVGEPWRWTSWRSTSTLPDGTRVESTDEITGDGIRVAKSVHGPDGTLQVTIREAFQTITAEECNMRFAELDAEPRPTAGGASDREQIAREVMAFFDRLIALAQKHQDDCDAMAAELQALVDSAKPLMEQARGLEEKDPGSKDWFEATYGQELEQRLEKELMPAMTKCAQHEGVARALDEIE